MQPERFVITPWFGNRPGASARALVLPGGGYTVDHPVLFWSCQVLAQAGYRVVTMRWQPDDQAEADPQAFVEEAADALEAAAGPAPTTLLLAKSLGSYAAAWASARDLPAVWLTPVLTDASVADALTTYPAAGLLVGGTADPLWDSEVARSAPLQVLELPGVDHALHHPGDWRASVTTLERTLVAVEAFAVQQERGVASPQGARRGAVL